MNRSKFASHFEEPYPQGLDKHKILFYRKSGDIVICLKHFRGFTKCLKWHKSQVQNKNLDKPKTEAEISYIYDKWIMDLFEPFQFSLQNLKRYPGVFFRASVMLARIKMGKIK